MNNDFELYYRWAELATLAQGLLPERRFAPFVRGQARYDIILWLLQ